MWTNIFLSVVALSLLNLSKGIEIRTFVGDNEVFNWTMKLLPPSDTAVYVEKNQGSGVISLYSVVGAIALRASNDLADRVTNINNSNTITGNMEFTLNDIRKEDGGDYRTRYQIPKQSVIQIGIRLIVYVKPSKPTLFDVLPPVDGKDMTLNCVAQSNSKPVDHGLEMHYKWYKNGAVLYTEGRYIISSSTLKVTNIHREDNNTIFSCKTFETGALVSDASRNYTVNVQYGPDSIVIAPSTRSYTLKENATLSAITCSSSCYPACTYSWGKNGSKVSSGQVLSMMDNIKRGQAGQYVCKATNNHGNKTSSVTVVVQYIPDKPVIKSNDNKADVRESLPLTLTCTTQSVPPANLTIHGLNMTILNVKDKALSSTLSIPHANCLDTGLFYCSAQNSIGSSKSNGFNVNVLCKPRPDHRVSQVLKQGLGTGDTMNISGTLISNPQPDIYWSMRKNASSVSSNLSIDDNFVVHNFWKVPTITSQVIRTAIRKDDFGEYLMQAANKYGKSVMGFTVTQRQNPDEPEIISLLCKLGTSVEIKFKPRFDGGDKQTFSIGMKSESDLVFKTVGEEKLDNMEKEMTLRGPILKQGVSYVFQVYATNTHGTTSSTNQRKCTIEKEFNFGAIIGGVVAGGVLIVAVVILVVCLVKRRRRTEKSDAIESINGRALHVYRDDQEDGMKPNIIYESAGPRDKETDKNGNAQKETSVNAVYAEVVKPNNKKVTNDIYAEVVKPKGKEKGKGKKSKPGQQNVDVYENTSKIPASQDQPSRRKNNKGLVYIDVEIKGKDTNQKKNVIHGIQNKNEYADVDFSRRADPLPSDDEDTTAN